MAIKIFRPETLVAWLGVAVEIDLVVGFADPLTAGTRRVIPFELQPMGHDRARGLDVAEDQLLVREVHLAGLMGHAQISALLGDLFDLVPLHFHVSHEIGVGRVLDLDPNVLSKRHRQAEVVGAADVREVDGKERGRGRLNIAQEVHQRHLNGRFLLVVVPDTQDELAVVPAGIVGNMEHRHHAWAVLVDKRDLGMWQQGRRLGILIQRPGLREHVRLAVLHGADLLPEFRAGLGIGGADGHQHSGHGQKSGLDSFGHTHSFSPLNVLVRFTHPTATPRSAAPRRCRTIRRRRWLAGRCCRRGPARWRQYNRCAARRHRAGG